MAKDVLTIYLLYVVLYQTLALNVDIPLPTYEVARGDNAILPCTFQPKTSDNNLIVVSWMAHADVESDPEINIVTLYYNKPPGISSLDVSDEYKDRATLNYSIPQGTANLVLNSVKSADTRVYECKVQIPGDSTGKQVDTTKLVVLVAPSIPKCAIQGKAEFYQNINLTCYSDEGTPTPTYKWTSFDNANKPRPNPPKSTDVNGVLSLYNISTDTSGYFICTSTNKIRSNSCNLTLTVTAPSMNVASTAGIIGGVVVVLLILLVVVYCCCCRRKQEKHEDYAMGPTEETEYTDKEPHEISEYRGESSKSDVPQDNSNRHERYEDHNERDYDGSSDRYSDRRDDYDDRKGRVDDRRSDRNDDRRSDRNDDRRSDRYDDRRSDRYDDRRSDRYDDRRSDRYDDRRSDRYDDDQDRYDDRRREPRDRYDDRYDDRQDRYRDDRDYGRDRPPNVPANKPSRG
ncbi:V-set and immunoglobulin domain-containing protein 2-like [Brachyhypopomus gauderio]|uniref:V-set and immunoglobulin domain-containing protein 2-like n=1 Tax=Brachyhypopomus gauderio TaxID=698409 RepID=UPI0040428836